MIKISFSSSLFKKKKKILTFEFMWFNQEVGGEESFSLPQTDNNWKLRVDAPKGSV